MTSLPRTTRIDPNLLEVILICCIGFLIYSNVLNGEFIADDYMMIVENPAVSELHNLQAIWQSFYTRFFVGLTFALNYRFAGFETFGYHIVNIVIHIVNALLVRRWVLTLFQTPVMSAASRGWPVGRIAFFAALIFLTHPIQTEAVSFITQRAITLVAVFYLLTIIAYLKARIENKSRYLVAAVLFMVFGLLTKECSFMLPVILSLHEIFFFQGSKETKRKRLGTLAIFFAVAFSLPLILMASPHVARLGLKHQMVTGYFDWNYFWTEINVFRTYLRLIFFPFVQAFDYDYPIAKGFSEGRTILSFLVISAIIAFAVYQFKRKRLISFTVAWFPVSIALEFIASCCVHRGVIYEHWLYLPMVSISMLIAWGTFDFLKNERKWMFVMTCLVALLAIMSYKRNFVWQNEIVFWEENLVQMPNNANVYYAAGIAHDRKNFLAQAVPYYLKAIAINPKHLFAMNNLAIDYTQLGRKDLAIQYFERAEKVDPKYKVTYDNLAFLYRMYGDEKNAQEVLKRRNDE